MPLPKFIVYTTAGCLAWNAILIYLGWLLGKNWTEVAGVSHYLIIAAIIAIVVIVLVYLILRRSRKRKEKLVEEKSKLEAIA